MSVSMNILGTTLTELGEGVAQHWGGRREKKSWALGREGEHWGKHYTGGALGENPGHRGGGGESLVQGEVRGEVQVLASSGGGDGRAQMVTHPEQTGGDAADPRWFMRFSRALGKHGLA